MNKIETEKKILINFRVSRQEYEFLRNRSSSSGRPMTRIVEDALLLYYQKNEPERMIEVEKLKRSKRVPFLIAA